MEKNIDIQADEILKSKMLNRELSIIIVELMYNDSIFICLLDALQEKGILTQEERNIVVEKGKLHAKERLLNLNPIQPSGQD